MMQAGVSTLGVLLGYAEYADTKPSAFTKLGRIASIGGISLETEQLDGSTLEDVVTRYIAGRQDTGGAWEITVNVTDETLSEWETVIAADTGKGLWFEVWSPYTTKAFFVVAQVPKAVPMPETEQNSVWQVSMSLTINTYHGPDTAVKPTGA